MFIKRHLEYSLLGGDPNIRIDRFPDGQQNVTILNPVAVFNCDTALVTLRMNSFLDLELLGCFLYSFKELNKEAEVTVYCPYLLGARSDRVFEVGGNNYLTMLENILLSFKFQKIFTLDVHNPRLPLSRLQNIELETLLENLPGIKDSIKNVLGNYDRIITVSPDKGAIKRTKSFTRGLGLNTYTIELNKTRTLDSGIIISGGHLLHTYSENTLFLIVDDICDGGGTFIKTAEYLRSEGYKGRLGLWVTHGIFSKGFTELKKHLEFIITTNSYADFGGIEQGSVKDKDLKGFLHQINVF